MTLMLRVVAHDKRETIYKNLCKFVDTPRGTFEFVRETIDRTEGRPTKKIEKAVQRESKFFLMMKDGTVVPALPEKVGGGATPAAASAEDAMILGLQPVRI
jgi:hypothetical protein